MLVTRQAMVICIDRLQAGLRCMGSSLAVPLPWWGTESDVPYSCTLTNSNTPCTVGRRSGIHKLLLDRLEVEQVRCLFQIQHCGTYSQDC